MEELKEIFAPREVKYVIKPCIFDMSVTGLTPDGNAICIFIPGYPVFVHWSGYTTKTDDEFHQEAANAYLKEYKEKKEMKERLEKLESLIYDM